jgi:hypothetical protein
MTLRSASSSAATVGNRAAHVLGPLALLAIGALTGLPGDASADDEIVRTYSISETDLSVFLNAHRGVLNSVSVDIRAPDGGYGDERANGFLRLRGEVLDDRDNDENKEQYFCQWDYVLNLTHNAGHPFPFFFPEEIEMVQDQCRWPWNSDEEVWAFANKSIFEHWFSQVLTVEFSGFNDPEAHATATYHADRIDLSIVSISAQEPEMLRKIPVPTFTPFQGAITD